MIMMGRGKETTGTNLGRLLHVLCVILLDVMVRANRLLQLISNHNSGALGAGATAKEHHPCPRVWESILSKSCKKTRCVH